MLANKKIFTQHPELLLRDGIALFLAVNDKNELATRQLLNEWETTCPNGYGKQVVVKTLPLMSLDSRAWLKSLY